MIICPPSPAGEGYNDDVELSAITDAEIERLTEQEAREAARQARERTRINSPIREAQAETKVLQKTSAKPVLDEARASVASEKGVTNPVIRSIVDNVKQVAGHAWRAFDRNLDRFAGKNREFREQLTNLLERPFNEAADRYTKARIYERTQFRNRMAALNITEK